MLLTTAGVIQGHRIVGYRELLSVDIPIGRSGSAIDNVKEGFGVRGSKQQTAIDVAREKGLALFKERAVARGANGVIGLQLHVVSNARDKRILLLTGTPVTVVEASGDTDDGTLGLLRQLQATLTSWSLAATAPSPQTASPTAPMVETVASPAIEDSKAGTTVPDESATRQLEAAPAFTEDDIELEPAAPPDSATPVASDAASPPNSKAMAEALAGVGNGYRR